MFQFIKTPGRDNGKTPTSQLRGKFNMTKAFNPMSQHRQELFITNLK